MKALRPLHSSNYFLSKTVLANVLLSSHGNLTEMAHSIEARTLFLNHVSPTTLTACHQSLKIHYTLKDEDRVNAGGGEMPARPMTSSRKSASFAKLESRS